jgi:hypothetical protein
MEISSQKKAEIEMEATKLIECFQSSEITLEPLEREKARIKVDMVHMFYDS